MDYINNCLGLSLEPAAVAKLLQSMQLQAVPAAAAEGGASLAVAVPPTRSDILHACDVMEDVAIAYGYNNLSKQVSYSVVLGGWSFLATRPVSEFWSMQASQRQNTTPCSPAALSGDGRQNPTRLADLPVALWRAK